MVLNSAQVFGANSGEWHERQIAFFPVETSHFPLSKFQEASHNTEVGYATNDRSGEPLTRK